MTSDAVPLRTNSRPGASAGIGWRSILVLAAVLLAAVTSYGVGVLLPYFGNGLHRLPLAEVASGAHDPKDLWPRHAWSGLVQLAGLCSLMLVPLVAVGATGLGGVWLALLSRRAEHQRVPKLLVVLVVVVIAASTWAFLWSGTGAMLSTWRLD